jgi:hypothetical protein
MATDLRDYEVLHHVALSADHAHSAHMLNAAIDAMKNRINEYPDREHLKLVIAVVRLPKQAAAAPAAKPAATSTR